ncbi:23S rRNA pseudouridylate synthase [Corynebacterium pseudotuberculosis]|uniref:pseudouridine synthase n=1 Tax=Corynebacterium pseudotuberculosis TaxID=1719 RepID=UPI000737D710|nr:pseudouridine synthase [Corynebacterium pseudotuberculosis]ALU21149.1 23S rRNA pseudouridylate synthase [Corynebacterium pseudotuberculosis]
MSMEDRVVHVPRGQAPLPVKNGLNPTRVRVSEEHAGMSAYEFVWHLIASQRRRHPDDTTEALLSRFQGDQVIIGPKFRIASPESTLKANEDIWFYRTPAPEIPVPYSCETIYEDDNLLVVNKPPFLATMPRGKHITQTATVQMRRATGNGDLSPAHRLDRLTSGILVFTKNRKVRGAYQSLFAERKVTKTYHAIAPFSEDLTGNTLWRDHMIKTPGDMQGHIVPGPPNAETLLVDVTELDAQETAQLQKLHHVTTPLARYTLQPHTGRTHQLRLHMWAAGVPILGDPAYPVILAEEVEDFRVPMHLTAYQLTFLDPFSNTPRCFTLQ